MGRITRRGCVQGLAGLAGAASGVLAGGRAMAGLGPDPITPGDMVGRFRYVGGSRQRDELLAAIDAIAEEMNFMIRGYVRRKLQETNQIPANLAFGLASPGLRVQIPGLPPIVAPTDGTRVIWHDQFGEAVKLRQRLSGRKLIQQFSGEQGSRDIVYRLGDEGRLRFSVTIASRHLPWPLRYRLSYRRS